MAGPAGWSSRLGEARTLRASDASGRRCAPEASIDDWSKSNHNPAARLADSKLCGGVLVSGVFDFLPANRHLVRQAGSSHRRFTSSTIFPPEWPVLLNSCALRASCNGSTVSTFLFQKIRTARPVVRTMVA